MNQKLGGTIELRFDGDEYRFPVELSAEKVRSIVEEEADEDYRILDGREPFFSLSTGMGSRVDFLIPQGDGGEVRGVALYDRDGGVSEVYEVDDLLQSSIEHRLTELPQIDSSLAEILVDEYQNLRTISWATTSDVTYLENTYDLDCHQLREQLQDHDLYQGRHSDDAGPLMFPERRKDELHPGMKRIDFEVLPYEVSFDDSDEAADQASLDDL